MGDGYDCAGILLEMLFEPVYGFCVEVVGGLVEKKHVGLLEQQSAQCHTAAFASRKCRYELVVGRTLQSIHGAFELGVYVPCIGSIKGILQFCLTGYQRIHLVGIVEHVGIAERFVDAVEFCQEIHDRLHSLADHIDHRLVGIKLWILLKVAHGIAGGENHFALIALVESGDDFQQG